MENVERSTAIRKLTMTCWTMRYALLPILWRDVEACLVPSPNGHTYGLYEQCAYLLSNPTIATYVQCVRPFFHLNITHGPDSYRVLSVDLRFKDAPKDLMKRFINTLARLPNLRRLELLSVSHRGPVTPALKRKSAKFPNIREILVDSKYPDFVTTCPNLESLTFRYRPTYCFCKTINSCGAGLERVAGLKLSMSYGVRCGLISTSSPGPEHLLSWVMQQS